MSPWMALLIAASVLTHAGVMSQGETEASVFVLAIGVAGLIAAAVMAFV